MQRFDGVYVISVAARILEMHPQTLRKYERFGLVAPARMGPLRRLYSDRVIARLKLIKHMVDDLGLNLAGVELYLNILNRLLDMQGVLDSPRHARDLKQEVKKRLAELLDYMGAGSAQPR